MNSMKKKLIKLLLIAISTTFINVPVFADSNPHELNEKIIMSSQKSDTDISPQANDWDYKWVDVDSKTLTKVRIGEAGNQPSKGTVFTSPGGFFWQDGSPFVELSLGFTFGKVTVNAAKGSVGSTGDYISAPVDVPCKLIIYKDIKVTKYAVYRKKPFTSQEWTFDRYEYRSEYPRVYLVVEEC